MMNEFNPDGKDIRFIDSHYRDLFRIPDGGTIQVHYSDDSVVIKPCKFIDEYHTQIGNNVFHICQFAELLERNGSYCQAEPEIMGDEAAWQVGRDQYLATEERSSVLAQLKEQPVLDSPHKPPKARTEREME